MNLVSRKRVFAGAVALSAALTACADLDVTNPNNPDVERALKRPADVKAVIGSSFNTWHVWTQNDEGPLAMLVGADVATASFGNFGMRFNSNEPRLAYNNGTASPDRQAAVEMFEGWYGAIGQANDGLGAVKAGVLAGSEAESPAMVALAHLVQGLSFMQLGFAYDSAYVVDEDSVAAITAPGSTFKPSFQPYTALRDAALAKIDLAIADAAGATWTVPAEYTGGGVTLTVANFAALANSMAARTLAYTPRTPAENDAVDWARVLAYAEKGISVAGTYDSSGFFIEGDGGNTWYDLYKGYANRPTWMRTDVRVINMMAPAQPAAFVGCTAVPKVTGVDKRFDTDWKYYADIPFSVARGCYHFSNYAHDRYFYHSWDAENSFTGRAPFMLKAENDLLIAEALIRTNGDLGRAATLINRTRVGRGQLAAVTAGDGKPALLAALNYERTIELFNTSAALGFYDGRRTRNSGPNIATDWPEGMWRHYPVPAKELEVQGKKVYTYGGTVATEK